MGRAVLTLKGQFERARARSWIDKAPYGTRVSFAGPQRSLDQNAKMWAMLTDISLQVLKGIDTEKLKAGAMNALGLETEDIMNPFTGRTMDYGKSSSQLSVSEMADLITLIQAWGDTNGVVWSEPQPTEETRK
jgi:hypothetical protein